MRNRRGILQAITSLETGYTINLCVLISYFKKKRFLNFFKWTFWIILVPNINLRTVSTEMDSISPNSDHRGGRFQNQVQVPLTWKHLQRELPKTMPGPTTDPPGHASCGKALGDKDGGWAGKSKCGKLVMYGIILGHLHLRYCGDFSQRVELVSLKRPASQSHNGCIYNLNIHNLGIASTWKPQYLLRNTSELFNTSHYYMIHI